MEIVVFQKEAYYKMVGELISMFEDSIRKIHDEAGKNSTAVDWIELDEAKRLLGLKSKTVMQRLRSNGDIVFTKYGKKIKYSRKSIMEYLNKNKISFR